MNNELEKNQKQMHSNIEDLLIDGSFFIIKNFENLNISNYNYEIGEAVKELFLDEEVVHQLVEDYIIQILKSKITFYKFIDELKEDKVNNRALDYINIRDLAHKNLGVARNLHIQDAEKLLKDMMNEENLERLELIAKALEISAIKLNPPFAYEILKLIEVKNSL